MSKKDNSFSGCVVANNLTVLNRYKRMVAGSGPRRPRLACFCCPKPTTLGNSTIKSPNRQFPNNRVQGRAVNFPRVGGTLQLRDPDHNGARLRWFTTYLLWTLRRNVSIDQTAKSTTLSSIPPRNIFPTGAELPNLLPSSSTQIYHYRLESHRFRTSFRAISISNSYFSFRQDHQRFILLFQAEIC